ADGVDAEVGAAGAAADGIPLEPQPAQPANSTIAPAIAIDPRATTRDTAVARWRSVPGRLSDVIESTSAGRRAPLARIGVVGAGVMGAGIAQLALEAGHEVVLHDVDDAALDRARDRIADGLARRAARLLADSDSIDDWVDGRIARLRGTEVLETLG